MEGAYKSSQRAEMCTLLSYRVGIVVLLVLAILMIAFVVYIVSSVIDMLHLSRSTL